MKYTFPRVSDDYIAWANEKTKEEILKYNVYVPTELETYLKNTAYDFNMIQIKKNFMIVSMIIMSILSVYEFFRGTDNVVKVACPCVLVVAAGYYLFNLFRYKKESVVIKNKYNKVFRHLCYRWSKFRLEDSPDPMESVWHGMTSTQGIPVRIFYTNRDKEDVAMHFEFKCEAISDSMKEKFEKFCDEHKFGHAINNLTEGKYEFLVTKYQYDKDFESFYDNYDLPNTTKLIQNTNFVMDKLYDILNDSSVF